MSSGGFSVNRTVCELQRITFTDRTCLDILRNKLDNSAATIVRLMPLSRLPELRDADKYRLYVSFHISNILVYVIVAVLLQKGILRLPT